MRVCSKCSRSLPLSEYGKQATGKLGLKPHCRDCEKARLKFYYAVNKAAIQKKQKVYYQNHKETISAYKTKHARSYRQRRRKTDLLFKLKDYLRNRLNLAIRGRMKSVSAVNHLGCSIEELRSYIEAKFYSSKSGIPMTWKQWGAGPGKWQIDHIREFQDTDLTNSVAQAEVVHFSNLQPLWFEDHVQKSKNRSLV